MMEAVLSSNLLKTGKLDLNREEFDLVELLTQLCEEQSNLARGHKIQLDVPFKELIVNLDKKFVTIILTNLLSNAVKFTDSEKGIVTIKLSHTLDNMTLVVSDNGVGIPKDELPKLFTRFFRASTSSGIPGSGVGLSLVHELVNLHKGRILVDSDVGQGCRFTLSLPQDFSLEHEVANL